MKKALYHALIVMTLDYEINLLRALQVWGEHSKFEIRDVAHDGEQALELLRNKEYDLVISEVNLPVIDGIQLLKRVRGEKLAPLFVVLSGTADFQYARECIIYGAFDYLQKMPQAKTMLDMFRRAEAELIRQRSEADLASNEVMSAFQADLRTIVGDIILHNEKGQMVFAAVAESILRMNQEYTVKGDIQLRQIFRGVIDQVFERCKWLRLYREVDEFYSPDALRLDSRLHAEEAYLQKLGKLSDFIAELYPKTSDSIIQEVVEYVVNHPEEDLHLKSIAAMKFVNYSYLSNAFSVQTGITYSEYVCRVRMARALYLLSGTDMRAKDIALRLGYRDYVHFAKLFRKQYNLTPNGYREEHRPKIHYEDYAQI